MERSLNTHPSRQLRRFGSHEEQEEQDLRYWRDQSVADKLSAVAELAESYASVHRIDLDAQGIAGVTFEEAWRDRVDFDIEVGVFAHYLSLEALIRNKEQLGRPGDLADVHELRKMRDLK